MNDEPKLELSSLSQEISSGGRTVRVEIYRLEGDSARALEVVDEYNNSTVWDDAFETESCALTEAKKTILADRIDSLIGPEDGKAMANGSEHRISSVTRSGLDLRTACSGLYRQR